MTDELFQSPLDREHRAARARMVPFGGWEMPLSYPAGTLSEHMSCRHDAVVFDVSHLGMVRVGAGGAYERLQRSFTNDLGKIAPGRAQYTHLLDESDAAVLDDIIVWWHPRDDAEPDVFDVMPNASNTTRVLDAIGGRDITRDRAMLAVQGPNARQRLSTVFPAAAEVGRFRVARCEWAGVMCTVGGTGYTGEPGVEIAVPAAVAADLWQELLDAGIPPAGLGARDTLRLEAALPLHGNELGPGITPLHANLGWVVAWDKGDFVGREALAAVRERGIDRTLAGIVTEGRRPPRQGCHVMVGDRVVGQVSSGNFSPVLQQGIALAFVEPDLERGTEVAVDVRGSLLRGVVVDTPFVPTP